MPTSMMVSSLRLLFVLLLSCALCLNAQVVLNNFFNLNGSLPVDGSVYVITDPISTTTHPGPLIAVLSAGFSVEMCITPYAAVSSNLLYNCPKNSYYNFDYYYNLTIPPINLFLDDFSMNFRGQYLSTNGSAPYTNLTTSFSLLQNVDYFISLSFGPTYTPPNATFADFWLYLFENNDTCTPGLTIPGKTNCVPITGTLTPVFPTYNIRSLSSGNPAIVAFQILNLTTSVVINLQGLYPNDTIEDLVLDIAYNALPTSESSQYHLATISTNYVVTSNSNQSFTLLNPLIGNYYAQVKSLQKSDRDITFSYIPPAGCTIPTTTTGSCGSTNYTVLGDDVDTLDLTATWTYYAVSQVSNLQFGVQLTESFNGTYNGTFSVLIGNNYFPSTNTLNNGIGNSTPPSTEPMPTSPTLRAPKPIISLP
eukprot:TRINITY_DN321_c0_g1_i2.p1 TRINITY_DN321_c0_g1~~TRINITY_DN321_c0_g1_i2.p1  ORF type:complete len:422 (+),score=56.75 TRINITY_DN321_c0_g1_i2:113-1378(+)